MIGSDLSPIGAAARSALRRRLWAAWIDIVLIAIAFVITAALSGGIRSGRTHGTISINGGPTHTFNSSGTNLGLSGLPALVFLAAVLPYYFFTEATTGQTLGKRLTGVMVANSDGGRAGSRAVLVRNITRIIDGLPVFYLVGWLALKREREIPQRFGDSLAKTTVIATDRLSATA